MARVVGLRLEGVANVPTSGPVLVVSNHVHNADPIVMEIAFPRPLHYMAKRELFGIPIVGWVSHRVGAFPVDRGRADRGALRHAEAVLKQGIAVGMFPEGTRSPTRSLRSALPGVGMVALRTGVAILPVAITGTERLPLNGGKGGGGGSLVADRQTEPGIRVRFGPVFHLVTDDGSANLGVQEATDRMMEAVAALLPPNYRGVYGEE